MPIKSHSEAHRDAYHTKQQELAEKLLLPLAKDGEWWAIRNILGLLSESLHDNAPLTPNLAAYLADALSKIASGSTHQEAFQIRRKRGEKDTRAARQRAFLNAYRVEYWRSEGKTLEEAIATVSADTATSEDTIKWGWKQYHREAKREIDLEMKHLGKKILI